jgi:alkylated DNA repair dioxygenase AlkB
LTPPDLGARLERMFAPELAPWQGSLFGMAEPAIDPAFSSVTREHLDETSWIDHLPRWMAGADVVFAALVERLPWRQRRVRMYDRMVDEPRLTCWWPLTEDPAGLPVLGEAAAALTARYERPFDTVGCNLYRHGRDSVAWHRDRERHRCDLPVVAILSVGAPRPFLVRPFGGGRSRAYLLGQGDLLVMGGRCQHDWEHTVPKVARAEPRLSITFRHETGDLEAAQPPR